MDLDCSPRRFPARRLGLAAVLVAWLSLLVSQGRAQPLDEWTLIDIENPGGSRIVSVEGTCLTMETSNTAPNHGIEHGGFLYHELRGDGAIEVQVESLVRSGFAELPFLALELRYSELPGSPLVACAIRGQDGWLPWLGFRDPGRVSLAEEPIPPLDDEDLLAPPNMILRLERRGDVALAIDIAVAAGGGAGPGVGAQGKAEEEGRREGSHGGATGEEAKTLHGEPWESGDVSGRTTAA